MPRPAQTRRGDFQDENAWSLSTGRHAHEHCTARAVYKAVLTRGRARVERVIDLDIAVLKIHLVGGDHAPNNVHRSTWAWLVELDQGRLCIDDNGNVLIAVGYDCHHLVRTPVLEQSNARIRAACRRRQRNGAILVEVDRACASVRTPWSWRSA